MKDDLISKQTAINAKQEFRNPNVIRDTESRTAYDRTYANGWNDCNKAWINAIEKLPPAQPNKGYIEQIKWERDMAIQQLKELRYGLGEKIRTDEDTISRRAAIDLVKFECGKWTGLAKEISKQLKRLPSAQTDEKLRKIADLVEGSIDHFDRDDAMDLLCQIKEIVGNETSNIRG